MILRQFSESGGVLSGVNYISYSDVRGKQEQ